MQIKKLKNGKFRISLGDDKYIITYDEVILKNNILGQKTIDEVTLKKIIVDTEYYDVYNKVLKYLKRKLRSEYEINKYLTKLCLNQLLQEKIVSQLKNQNLINDSIFAKAYINDKINLTKQGPKKIKNDLLNHNININILEKLIADIEEDIIYKKLEKLIKNRILINKKYSKKMLYNKILINFISLGFEVSMIKEIFNKLYVEDKNIVVNEYKKYYNRLKIKYIGKELDIKVKQKLYQLGFSHESIKELQNKGAVGK